jgi:hypothetical protein
MIRLLLIATIISLQGPSTYAFAQSIPVPNFSFEADVQSSDPAATPGATSWFSIGTTYTDNPPSDAFTGAGGFGTPTGGLGAQSGYLGDSASFQSTSSLAMILAPTTYTLTVAIGDRATGLIEPATLRIGFLINDAFVSSGDTNFGAANYSPEGTFRDFTFQYTASPADVGKTLKIYLGQSGFGSVNFDNVRLSVPEPSSALLLLSAAALCVCCRMLCISKR